MPDFEDLVALSERMSLLLSNPKKYPLEPVELLLRNGSTIPAHKGILAAASPVFEVMFRDTFFYECTARKIQFSSFDEQLVIAIVKYIYTAELPENFLTPDNVIQMMVVASELQLEPLKNLCARYVVNGLRGSISADNVGVILGTALVHRCSLLEASATEYLELHSERVLKDMDCSMVSFETMYHILSLDSLTAREETVFSAVVRWFDAHKHEKDVVETQQLPSLLRKLRHCDLNRDRLTAELRTIYDWWRTQFLLPEDASARVHRSSGEACSRRIVVAEDEACVLAPGEARLCGKGNDYDSWCPPLCGRLLYVNQSSRNAKFVEYTVHSHLWMMALTSRIYASGRVLAEFAVVATKSTTNAWRVVVGVVADDFVAQQPGAVSSSWIGRTAASVGYIAGTGHVVHDSEHASTRPFGAPYTGGDKIGVAIDFHAGSIEFFKNNISQGVLVGTAETRSILDGGSPVRFGVSFIGKGSVVRLVAVKGGFN